MPIDFTAIDFETANSSSASACSVGLVKVRDGRVVDRTGWFIRPPYGHDVFAEGNVRIHGIVPADVADAPFWAEQLVDLLAFAGGDVLVAHNARFDLGVIRGASLASRMPVPYLRYLCSLRVARRTYQLDSYRLPVAASAAGHDGFQHHDALADSEACAAIVVHAAARHGVDCIDDLAEATGGGVQSIGDAESAPTAPRWATVGRGNAVAEASAIETGAADASGWAVPLGAVALF